MFGRALDAACGLIAIVSQPVNDALDSYSPLTLIAGTVAAVLIIQEAHAVYINWNTRRVKNQLFDTAVKIGLRLPRIGDKIQKELSGVGKELEAIRAKVDKSREQFTPFTSLPEQGLPHDKILARFEKFERDPHHGRASGAIYAKYDEATLRLLEKVWGMTALTNPMHTAWPLLQLMEAEVISMCSQLMHGVKDTRGIMTHGGTTSIVEACFAYARLARENGIEKPEVIIPSTAHIAFDKAANYLNFRLITVPVDRYTGAADVAAMESAITRRTCLLVGSAPSFPFGAMDPITELGQLARRRNLPLHVDACLGGFINAFAAEAGFNLPPFDFAVPGVTSISMDTHKYGQTPKGSSILLFHPDCQASTTHVHLGWVGGMYVTPGIDGSRNGADIATTWAALCAKGKRSYVEDTRAILTLQRKLARAIADVEGVYVPFNPQSSVVGIKALSGLNMLVVASYLEEKKWSVNFLQTLDQQPDGFHFCLTAVHVSNENFLKDFIEDLSKAVVYAKANPHAAKGSMKVYGQMADIPFFAQRQIGEGYAQAQNSIRTPGLVRDPL